MNDRPAEQFSMLDLAAQTQDDVTFAQELGNLWDSSLGTTVDRLRNFSKFVPRQALSLFLAKNEIFKNIVNVHGQIIECGVFLGGGLMTWAQLSAIYEPINHNRRIVGFDTFSGFVELSEQDQAGALDYSQAGGLAVDAQSDLENTIRLFDLNRPLGHIPRVELVAGDATATIPAYLQANQHTTVAMLYLDFDLFEPTKVALETFLPRMPKGAVIAFDELNQSAWPGETLAVLETVGLCNLRIQRFPFTPALSYAVLD